MRPTPSTASTTIFASSMPCSTEPGPAKRALRRVVRRLRRVAVRRDEAGTGVVAHPRLGAGARLAAIGSAGAVPREAVAVGAGVRGDLAVARVARNQRRGPALGLAPRVSC